MAGNVYEWCADWFKTDYYKLKDAKKNPQGPEEGDGEESDFSGKKGKARVLRGGSWNFYPGNCRSVNRFRYFPPERGSNCGFRAVVVAPAW